MKSLSLEEIIILASAPEPVILSTDKAAVVYSKFKGYNKPVQECYIRKLCEQEKVKATKLKRDWAILLSDLVKYLQKNNKES